MRKGHGIAVVLQSYTAVLEQRSQEQVHPIRFGENAKALGWRLIEEVWEERFWGLSQRCQLVSDVYTTVILTSFHRY